MNIDRCHRLVRNAIDTFALDLSGMIVLTEAASGFYALTPVIAALAGAEKVFCLTRDSAYATATDAISQTTELAQKSGLADRIEILPTRTDRRITDADIVTNLGFVRPIDPPLIARLHPQAVVPLMWETWEYRAADLDLQCCRNKDIPVLGTNEHHPDLQTFRYVGWLAAKLLLSADIEIMGVRIAVLGSGPMAAHTATVLHECGADVVAIEVAATGIDDVEHAIDKIIDSDATVVVEHQYMGALFSDDGGIDSLRLSRHNPGHVVVHICGRADRRHLTELGIRCTPEAFAAPGRMSVTTDYVGPKPLIDLHTAGLKVGAEMAARRSQFQTSFEVEMDVLRCCTLAHGFSGYHN